MVYLTKPGKSKVEWAYTCFCQVYGLVGLARFCQKDGKLLVYVSHKLIKNTAISSSVGFFVQN